MSKNMTRKGLAIGAASSLLLAGIVGVPAQANGLADTSFVSLAPNAGTEYDVLTGSQEEFALKANAASSVYSSGAYLKFLVTDTSGTIVADQGSSKSTKYTETHTAAKSGTTVTLTIASGSTKLKDGDRVFLSGASNNTGLPTATTAVVVDVTSTTTFTITAADSTALSSPGNITVTLAPNAVDATTTTFVYQTRNDSAASDSVLVLETANAETLKRSVTVRAWIDSNANDKIDSTEYASPVRTVVWNTSADVTAVTTLTYPTAGDTSLRASVVLTPNLNEEQMTAGDIQIGFTRPGSTETIYANATQNDTTRAWSASQSLETGAWLGMPHIFELKDASVSSTTATLETKNANGLVGAADTVVVDASNNAADLASAGTATVTSGNEFTVTVASGSLASNTADTGYVRVVTKNLKDVGATTTRATYETEGAHGLSVGDIVTIDAAATANSAQFDITRAVVSSVLSATEFTVAGTFVAVTADTADNGNLTYVSFVEAVPGSYSAKTKVATVVRGNTSSNVTVASTSDDTVLATTATTNVQGVSNSTNATTTVAYVRKAEKSVELTVSVFDEDEDSVSAGRPVVVTLGNTDTNSTQSGTFTVNGTRYTAAVTLLTDANGQVKFTVADDDGAVSTQVKVTAVPENLTGAKTAEIDLIWSDTVYTIFDLNDSAAAAATGHNSIVAGGTYTYALSVLDQWKSAPTDGTHRVKFATTGRTVATGYVTLSAGKGTYTVADSAISGSTAIQTVFTLEKLATDGTWTADQELLNDGDTTGTGENLTYATSVVASTQVDAVLLDSDGSTAYGSDTADLSDTATTKQLVEQDRRVANLVQPTYGSAVTVTGRVANSVTNVPRAGTVVTISGPQNILFSEGAVDKRGSLTIKTDGNGEFAVNLYSNTAQTDTVITVTSGAGSKTVKVSFTGLGASFGTAIDIAAPTTAKPGTSFKVTATLKDKLGNAVVSTTGDRIKVTYDGPGIVIAAMPTDTDLKGQVSFVVLLGTNDSGTGIVTVAYDQGDDGDFTGTTTADADVVVTKTITVGTGAASGTGKVNVGSFNGKLVVYAANLNGARISWKVGGNWGSAVADSNYDIFNRPTPRAGVTLTVDIYVNGVKTLTKSVVSR